MFITINEKDTVNTDHIVAVRRKDNGSVWVYLTGTDDGLGYLVASGAKVDELQKALETENQVRLTAVAAAKKRGGTANDSKNDK